MSGAEGYVLMNEWMKKKIKWSLRGHEYHHIKERPTPWNGMDGYDVVLNIFFPSFDFVVS